MSELSRVEDLLKTGVEEPVLPMSRLEAILRGEKITPQSRVEELLLQYNPSDILIEKRITANGTYFAVNDNADGYFKVVVDTPVVPPTVLDHLVETITENGTYTYTPEHDGFEDAEITVNVSSVTPVLDDITITENGVYTSEHDGFDEVTVNVESHDTTPKAIISDKFSIVAKAESAVRDYYANHILIGSSSQVYIMTPLDKNLINGTYAWVMYDGSSTFNGLFTYSGSDITFSIDNSYDMKITGTSAGLTWWRGSWRDIYMDIYRLKEA